MGGTPKKITRFAVMLTDKIYAGFCKKFHSKTCWGFVRWSDRAAAEKIGVNYTIPTLTSYAEKLGKKCTIPSLTTYKLQSKDAGQFKSRLAIAKQSTNMRRLFINYNQICQLQGNRNCIV